MSLTELRGLDEPVVMDTSEDRPVFLLVGAHETYLRISESAYQFLQKVRQGSSFEQLAALMSRQDGTPLSATEVETAYHRLVDRIARFQARAEQPRGVFWFRRRLIPGAVVARAAAVCSVALHPVVAVVMVAAIVVSAVLSTQLVVPIAPGHFWQTYALFVVSLLAHELGHASACARYGAQPSDIGIIIYLIFPSFYSDVTVAWELKRWQRVVVDLGGVYFQLIFGVGCVAAYALTSWEPLVGTLLLIVTSCLFSLNPILKFDGYWVVADALGVTNLARQPARITRHLIDLARGRAVRALPWTRLVIVALGIYAVVASGFWAWFMWRLLPAVGHQVARCIDVGSAFGHQLLSAPPWPDRAMIGAFATSTFMLLFVLLMAGRLLWPGLAWTIAKLRK